MSCMCSCGGEKVVVVTVVDSVAIMVVVKVVLGVVEGRQGWWRRAVQVMIEYSNGGVVVVKKCGECSDGT